MNFFVSSGTLHTCISDCQVYELTDGCSGKLLFPCSVEVMLLCKCEFSCVKISLPSLRAAELGETVPNSIFTNDNNTWLFISGLIKK